MYYSQLLAILSILTLVSPYLQAKESWTIVVGHALQEDEAVRLAVEDLIHTGSEHSLTLVRANDSEMPDGNAIFVGNSSRNALVDKLFAKQTDLVDDEQGYSIRTAQQNNRRQMLIAGGSPIGDAYGLYWVWDRLRVHKQIPDINTNRSPAMKMRFGAAWGRHGAGGSSLAQMRQSLRYSTNWVSGPAILDLVPWDSEPEATQNRAQREETRKLIDYAHRLHMKYFAFANEFTYHPSLLEEFNATLSPDDPKLWQAVQAKFRKLLTALPELDGVELCNDDISGFWDNYVACDLLHNAPECDWSYEKRFNKFVKKVHEVVADEFDKTYFHFTWGLTTHEQHYQPAVYRKIFNSEIPTNNLYLIPKITVGDRWWHQPYNPTFNQTPHETLVCFETMNYYESGSSNLFPTFSGQYFQAGLQSLMLPEDSNLVGAASLAGVRTNRWDTNGAYSYLLYRLMWDPYEDVAQIARDFCAIHFGNEAADAMAEIYLASPAAYKYGLHIDPVVHDQFNSLVHMRVGTFPAEGYPSLDHGREHLDFLRRIYLRCKPWLPETYNDLNHGLEVARSMRRKFEKVKPHLADAKLANNLENRLAMTERLIATNLGYVRTTFALFAYLDDPTAENRIQLAAAYQEFSQARQAFISTPGFGYNLFGVDVVLDNARAALEDVQATKQALDNAPSRSQLEQTIAIHQQRYQELLDEHANTSVHFASMEISIDGRDILNLTGSEYSIDHLRWDGPHVQRFEIHTPLPAAEVTVIPKKIYSRPMHPFVLEQPHAENNYTARLYLDDLPGGKDWMKFDLYYIPHKPEQLGLLPLNSSK